MNPRANGVTCQYSFAGGDGHSHAVELGGCGDGCAYGMLEGGGFGDSFHGNGSGDSFGFKISQKKGGPPTMTTRSFDGHLINIFILQVDKL